jgi:hypothetical protein
LLVGAAVAVLLSLILGGGPGITIYYFVLRPWFGDGRGIGWVPNGGIMAIGAYVSLLWPWAIPLGYALARWRFAHRPLLLRVSLIAGVEYIWLWSICSAIYLSGAAD